VANAIELFRTRFDSINYIALRKAWAAKAQKTRRIQVR
jgi:hypothetical protein